MQIILVFIKLIAAFIVLYLFMIMPRMMGRPDFSTFKTWKYAHRGLFENGTDAPENSMPAFKKAVDAGYGIELDVQLTKDQIPVIFHDESLKRMCKVNKKVKDVTYDELQSYSLLNTSERIPTLQQVLHLVDGKTPLIVEYKETGFSTKVCELSDQLLQNYDGLYCIESFNPLAVLWYRTHRGHIVRGILSDSYKTNSDKKLASVGKGVLHHLLLNFIIKPDFVAYNHKNSKDLSRTLCYNLYKAPAAAWTIRSQEQLDANAKDFDIFIFEGFIPREETKVVKK